MSEEFRLEEGGFCLSMDLLGIHPLSRQVSVVCVDHGVRLTTTGGFYVYLGLRVTLSQTLPPMENPSITALPRWKYLR